MTRDQHVFPASAIRRFCGPETKVSVWTKRTNSHATEWATFRPCGPGEKIFYADYVWDQRAETWTSEVDRKYATIAEKYDCPIGEQPEVLAAEESAIVSSFYYLWQSRAALRDTPSPHNPIELKGVEQDQGLSPADLERCKELGVLTAHREGPNGFGAVPGRPFLGFQLQHAVRQFEFKWGSIEWACYEFRRGNLIVPDECKSFPYVPLSPTRCFVAIKNSPLRGVPGPMPYAGFAQIRSGAPDDPTMQALVGEKMPINETALNALAVANAKKYYFYKPESS